MPSNCASEWILVAWSYLYLILSAAFCHQAVDQITIQFLNPTITRTMILVCPSNCINGHHDIYFQSRKSTVVCVIINIALAMIPLIDSRWHSAPVASPCCVTLVCQLLLSVTGRTNFAAYRGSLHIVLAIRFDGLITDCCCSTKLICMTMEGWRLHGSNCRHYLSTSYPRIWPACYDKVIPFIVHMLATRRYWDLY